MRNPNSLKNVPVLETDRLILRSFSEKDVDDVYEYASNPIVTEFLPWEYHKTKEDSLQFLNYSKELFDSQDNIDFAIELKSKNKVIGSISIRKWNDANRCADIGYVLSLKYWRLGIMTEAIKRIVRFGFDELNVVRIEAHCDENNIGSYKAMGNAGLKYEGLLRKKVFMKNKFCNVKFYSILKEEFIK
jgi:ribosomal-protein-alanine N-acetyltransferase